ncbi:FecR family protein [Phragmitibacter flavus]|nr:FecR family protein [Phragmitibacter flavus]
MNDDLLLQRLLDGTLTSREQLEVNQRLRDDAGLRAQLREIAEQAVLMGDLARQRDLATPVSISNAADRSLGARHWLALAASIALLAASAGFWMSRREVPVLTLEDSSGSIVWSQRGDLRQSVADGDQLSAGTLETIGETATAQLAFADGTLIMLSGESELSFSEDGQKRLLLRRGSLSAQVKPQPEGSPMLVRTPSAEAEILGTVFNLSTRPDDTLLKVDEGLVRLRRLADGSSIEVPAKNSAVASLDSALKLNSEATPEPRSAWSFDFTTTMPPQHWRGVSDGTHIIASPYVASRKPSGNVVTHFGISVRTTLLTPPVSLMATEGGVVRYRFKQEQRAPLQVMLLTSKRHGGFGGNFEVKLSADDLHPDRDGWCEIAIPLREFHALSRKHPSPTGNLLDSVLISSFQTDTKLTVSRFELTTQP